MNSIYSYSAGWRSMGYGRRGVSERDTQKAILQFLALKRVLAYRMNTGAAVYETAGKKRFVRYGNPGMADILAITTGGQCIWIEVKAAKGKQSESQIRFQREVEKRGHTYLVARSVEDLYPLLGGVK